MSEGAAKDESTLTKLVIGGFNSSPQLLSKEHEIAIRVLETFVAVLGHFTIRICE
jgi:hypothetical protein